MRIPCPHCGERRQRGVFPTIGAADPQRPAADAPDRSVHDYVYLRDIRLGCIASCGSMSMGCRRWLVVDARYALPRNRRRAGRDATAPWGCGA